MVDFEFRPDELCERDEELARYQSALRPVINGARPKNVFLYGGTGVGKTLATQMVLDRLRKDQQDYQHLELHTVAVVCKSMSSSYQVATNLVNEFRDSHEEISTIGYPASAVYDMLWTHLDSPDATHCLNMGVPDKPSRDCTRQATSLGTREHRK